MSGHEVAVILPCHNEAVAIGDVVHEFRTALPGATVYVYDNDSTDDTARVAMEAGAIVRSESVRGKGNVVRRMFADVEADIYLMADGDGTYDAGSANALIDTLINDSMDMVVGSRGTDDDDAFPRGHRWGNRLFNGMVSLMFGNRFTDVFSGYRAFSRRFVKTFPSLATGFDTEIELTIHALETSIPVAEVKTPYRARPQGSASKLSTWRDGFLILWRMLVLLKEVRPFLFFSTIFIVLALVSVGLSWPIVVEFLETGLVPRIPTAILSVGIMLTAIISLMCGIFLASVSRGRREVKRMHYLGYGALR